MIGFIARGNLLSWPPLKQITGEGERDETKILRGVFS